MQRYENTKEAADAIKFVIVLTILGLAIVSSLLAFAIIRDQRYIEEAMKKKEHAVSMRDFDAARRSQCQTT